MNLFTSCFPRTSYARLSRARARWTLRLLLCLAAFGTTQAENTNNMVKPPVPIPGGLGLYPVITSVTATQGLATVQWFGIQGPFELLHSSTADSNSWEQVGPATFGSQLTVPISSDLGFFRVLSGRPTSTAPTGGTMNYVGAASCVECHADTVQEWAQTPHSQALNSLKAIGQQNNASCLVCHSVGFGTPLGFKSESATPHLSGVQCENCHGPAANHIAVPRDVSVRPKVTMASEMCGGCHNFHHPTFDEWKSSPHATPVPAVASSILQQGESRMMTCGVCHSGAVREALLESVEHPGTPLPSRVDAAYFGITCAVCHDAHSNMDNPPKEPNPLLRNPVYSLANFSYVTSSDPASFAAQYNPDIQVCAQCHNMRGARWQDTSRPPHHSPQYNLLVGQGGFDLGKSSIMAHGSDIPTQCIYCHSASLPVPTSNGPDATNYTSSATDYFGHTTQVDFNQCALCHITARAAKSALTNTQQQVKTEIANIKALLDQWATNQAPASLQSKYGTLAWEYNAPGELSTSTNNPTLTGPSSAEQAQVPDAIKQARFNLYLVQSEGSFGVHNGDYTRLLLNIAKTNVLSQLNQNP